MTFAGNFTNNGTLTNGAGTQVYTFTGANKTISGSGAIAFETWNINGGASITLGSLSGNTVSIASTFTGTVLNGGTLNTGAAANTVSGAGAFTLASGGTIITSNATGLDGAITVSGTKTFSTGANYEFRGAATGAALPSTVNNLTINRSSGDVDLNGAGGTQTVSNKLNVFSGNLNANGTRTNVNVAGTGDAVVMQGGGQINSNANLQLTRVSGGNVVFDAVNNGTATVAANMNLNGQTRTFNIADGSATSDMTVSGVILNGGLTKAGAGTLTLSSATGNTYSGNTAINVGTLLVTNTSGSGTGTGTVAVSNSGSVLGGTGIITGAVTVNAGANITGATNGTVGALTLTSTLGFSGASGNLATYLVDLSGATSDTLAITSSLSLSGVFDQITFNGTADGTTTYILATYSSVSGIFDTVTNLPGGYQLVYNVNGTELDLVPVPEPSTWAAGILAALAVVYTQRRRFSRFSLQGSVVHFSGAGLL